MDQTAQEMTKFYSMIRTVSETKRIEGILDALKFITSTGVNLHILTCLQIALCQHRENFSISWMG